MAPLSSLGPCAAWSMLGVGSRRASSASTASLRCAARRLPSVPVARSAAAVTTNSNPARESSHPLRPQRAGLPCLAMHYASRCPRLRSAAPATATARPATPTTATTPTDNSASPVWGTCPPTVVDPLCDVGVRLPTIVLPETLVTLSPSTVVVEGLVGVEPSSPGTVEVSGLPGSSVGLVGFCGLSGSSGLSGLPGLSGSSESPGLSGFSGSSGLSGFSGSMGSSGFQSSSPG
ncbi:MAG: hypothetical protein J6S63_10445 [Atopobiaceae bacterium]|nr:hypothetical protein [Atopobiaceae bacterium]